MESVNLMLDQIGAEYKSSSAPPATFMLCNSASPIYSKKKGTIFTSYTFHPNKKPEATSESPKIPIYQIQTNTICELRPPTGGLMHGLIISQAKKSSRDNCNEPRLVTFLPQLPLYIYTGYIDQSCSAAIKAIITPPLNCRGLYTP